MKRREFAGLLVTAAAGIVLPKFALAGLVTQSGPRYTISSGGDSCTGFTPDAGWTCSGTFADGQDVTVTKSAGGLGFSTDPRPLLWIPGSSSAAQDSTYSRNSTTTLVANSGTAVDTAIHPTNAAGSLRQTWPISGGDTVLWWSTTSWESNNTFSTGVVYASVKRYHNFNPDDPTNTGAVSGDYNDKTFRIWPATFGNRDLYDKIRDQDSLSVIEGDASDTQYCGSSSCSSVHLNFSIDTWYQHEHIFKENSALDAQDGLFRWYVNAGRANSESLGWQTRSTSQPNSKALFYLDQISNVSTNTDLENGAKHIWVADVYISDQLRRFTVSTESTCFTATTMDGSNDPGIFREIQLPRNGTGSDSSVGLHLRKGTYASMSGKYLCFWPNDGTSPERVGTFQ
ncbi:MAG TPA: hypothetical protein VFS24_08695 [Steroidobacteraceae bacterium]|nr:hypothetical protein [Steroidobacteraceae bacterium]